MPAFEGVSHGLGMDSPYSNHDCWSDDVSPIHSRQQQVTVRGGAVFTIRYSIAAQIMRTAAKFGFVWLIAVGLAQLESRLWLRLWIIGGPLIGLIGHFVYVRSFQVHWLSCHPLPKPT